MASRGSKISFREFVEYCNFPNEQAILDLLDRQEVGHAATSPTTRSIASGITEEDPESVPTSKPNGDIDVTAPEPSPEALSTRRGMAPHLDKNILTGSTVLNLTRQTQQLLVAWCTHVLQSRISIFFLGRCP